MGFNSANRVDERKERKKKERRKEKENGEGGGGSRNMTKVEPSEKLERRACE